MKLRVLCGVLLFSVSQALCVTQVQAALEPSQVMGQGLYEQKDGNSCLFCHGISGEGGNVVAAAKLDYPKTWKAYKALGGDVAYAKDSKAFLEKLKKATVNLLQAGAIRHNSSYKEDSFDWSKIQPYNSQMMGISGAASVSWMKKYQKRGVKPGIAAESLWLHLVTMDKQSFFK